MSSTHACLSSMSRASRDGVFDVLSVHYSNVRITIVNNIEDLQALVSRKPDLVFLGMGYIPSDPDLGRDDPVKIWICDYLDQNGIAYTGSPKKARLLENNKPLAKQRVLDCGLNSSQFFVTKHNQPLLKNDVSFPYPVFIKPANRGGGNGVDSLSVAHSFLEAERKVRIINDSMRTNCLIEEYLPGREFSVAVLRNEATGHYDAMPIELVAQPDENGDRMLSKDVKNSNSEVVSNVVDQNLKAKVSNLALNVFQALGARDYGRIDIRLDLDGQAFFLEANLTPSLIEGYGSFPKACLINNKTTFNDMILTIVRLGLARTPSEAMLPRFINVLSGNSLTPNMIEA